MKDFLKALLPRIEKMRNEVSEQCLGDYFLPDGTKVNSKEQDISFLAGYDDLLRAIKRRIDILESDSKCP